MKKAKIVATIGPASQKIDVLIEMVLSGVNLIRMNMSHGDYLFHEKTLDLLNIVRKKTGRNVGVLMDLQGPKIRVDKLEEPLILKTNEEWYVGEKKYYKSNNFIPTVYKNLVNDVKKEDRVLFDDGLIEAKVIKKIGTVILIKIITGGTLKSNKGINLPDSNVTAPSLTEKDKKDLMWGLSKNIDYIALSFVRNSQDIIKVKKIIANKKLEIPIIAKIEKPEAIQNIEKIIEHSDGIMIARGDMAVEVGPHLVPKYQKMIIKMCNQKGIPVITATQMLETMTYNTTPTRAEATDVFNAVLDGTDAVMLSGETATGIDPVNVVLTMNKIIVEAENIPKKKKNLLEIESSVTSAIQQSGMILAESVRAKYLISVTSKGVSCQRLAGLKPRIPVLGVTDNIKTFYKMSLYWGVESIFWEEKYFKNLSDKTLIDYLINCKYVKKDDIIVICRANSNLSLENLNNIKLKKI